MRTCVPVLLCLSALAACRREPQRRISLLDNPMAAEVRRETVGVPLLSEANEPNRLGGWSVPETKEPDKTAMWAMGERSELRFDLVRPRPLELHLAALPYAYPGRPEARMEVRLNDRMIEAVVLADGSPTTRVIPLPEKNLQPGENRLSFSHPWGKSPKELDRGEDLRPVAVWFSELGLLPAGEKTKAWRAAEPAPECLEDLDKFDAQLFSFTFPLPKNGRLQLHLLSTDSSQATMRVLQRLADLPRAIPLAKFEMAEDQEKRKTLKLRGKPGELTTVTFATEAEMGRYNRFRGIELLGDGEMPDWNGAVDTQVTSPISTPATRATPPKTILIFLVDALRADHLTVYGYDRPTSPELEDFARTAQKYSDAWAVSSWTKPAVATILTGLPPEENGAGLKLSMLREEIPYAPGLLKKAGYHAAAIVASPNAAAGFGFAREFDEFHDLTPVDPHTVTSGTILDRFRKILAAQPADLPLFVYLHLVDPHAPYGPQRRFARFDRPPPLAASPPPDSRIPDAFGQLHLLAGAYDNRIDRYDGEILQADAAFGEALAALKKAGRLDDALIIFTADHGEEFGDHGGEEHGRTLFAEVMRIPLLIRWPDGQGAGMTRSVPVSQLDLLPTILRAAGAPPLSLPGFPLQFPLPDGRLRYSSLLDGQHESSLRDGDWDYHLIRNRAAYPGQPGEFLFNLARDPGELNNVARKNPAVKAWLRARMNANAARLKAPATPEAADPELLRRLRELGYLR